MTISNVQSKLVYSHVILHFCTDKRVKREGHVHSYTLPFKGLGSEKIVIILFEKKLLLLFSNLCKPE